MVEEEPVLSVEKKAIFLENAQIIAQDHKVAVVEEEEPASSVVKKVTSLENVQTKAQDLKVVAVEVAELVSNVVKKVISPENAQIKAQDHKEVVVVVAEDPAINVGRKDTFQENALMLLLERKYVKIVVKMITLLEIAHIHLIKSQEAEAEKSNKKELGVVKVETLIDLQDKEM